jgi:hypothetical protein
MEEEFTLQEIEKTFFKTNFQEPRVFLALSFYATNGGPPFRNEPFTGKKLDKQLDEQVKIFLTSHNGFKIDAPQQTVYISALLDENQFGSEFIRIYATDKKFKDHPPATRAVLNFCSKYLTQQQVEYLETKRYKVKPIILDWNLNQQ